MHELISSKISTINASVNLKQYTSIPNNRTVSKMGNIVSRTPLWKAVDIKRWMSRHHTQRVVITLRFSTLSVLRHSVHSDWSFEFMCTVQ